MVANWLMGSHAVHYFSKDHITDILDMVLLGCVSSIMCDVGVQSGHRLAKKQKENPWSVYMVGLKCARKHSLFCMG